MNINEKLIQAASFNPTKKSHLMSIIDICKKIDEQSISLPLYQRDLSWSIQKCVALLNYQLLGKAPVSPISINVINNTTKCVPQVSFINRELLENIERGQYSVVDGQQRLTTNYKAYVNHDDFKTIVLDLEKGLFLDVSGKIKNYQIPVGVLLNKDDTLLFEYTQKKSSLKSPKVINILIQIKSKIKNYNYTINSAEDLSEDEQIEWFEVLNNAGSRVSIIQMRFSKLKAHGIDIYTQYTIPFRQKLSTFKNFFTPLKTNVSYPIAALNPAYEKVTHKIHSNNYAPIPSDTKEDQLCNLAPEKLITCIILTLKALDFVIKFIEQNNLKKPDRIDYINYLIGYFVFNEFKINPTINKFLINWYDKVDFTNKSNTDRRDLFNNLIENKIKI